MLEELKPIFEWLRTINFKADLLPWLPPIFTLAGWVIVNNQNNHREARKEARSAADRCKELTREVAQHGIEYWSGTGDVQPWKIRIGFEELEVETERFQDEKMRALLLELQVELVEAVMDNNFDTADFKPVDKYDPVFKAISAAKQRLLFAIERELAKQFR